MWITQNFVHCKDSRVSWSECEECYKRTFLFVTDLTNAQSIGGAGPVVRDGPSGDDQTSVFGAQFVGRRLRTLELRFSTVYPPPIGASSFGCRLRKLGPHFGRSNVLHRRLLNPEPIGEVGEPFGGGLTSIFGARSAWRWRIGWGGRSAPRRGSGSTFSATTTC